METKNTSPSENKQKFVVDIIKEDAPSLHEALGFTEEYAVALFDITYNALLEGEKVGVPICKIIANIGQQAKGFNEFVMMTLSLGKVLGARESRQKAHDFVRGQLERLILDDED